MIFKAILFALFEYVCGGGFVTGDSVRHVQEGFGNGACLYRGSVRGTWRKGSCTEDSERRVIEGSGNGVFLLYVFIRGI